MNRDSNKDLPSAQLSSELSLTDHALERMHARSVPVSAVRATLMFGRRVYVRGACIRAIGRKEVARMRRQGIDLADHEGVQVVCSTDGDVITVYRNHDLAALRPRTRRRRVSRLN